MVEKYLQANSLLLRLHEKSMQVKKQKPFASNNTDIIFKKIIITITVSNPISDGAAGQVSKMDA